MASQAQQTFESHDVVPGATSRNPATGEIIAHYPFQTPAEVEQTLAQSHAAFLTWRALSVADRAAVQRRLGDYLERHVDRLAAIITDEMGKTRREAVAEIRKCARTANWYADHGPAMLADEPVAVDGAEAYVSYRPTGTILAIMPWNFPIWQAVRAAVPITLGGNGFLLKHAPNVMGSAYAIRDAFISAGAPDGLFGILNVDNAPIESVIDDPRIAGVTLTGSVRAGSAVAAMAGKALKKSVLELGGSDPFIVLADADLDKAVTAAITSRFANAGQVCLAAKRFILEAPIAEAFTQKFVEAARALKVGDPKDPATSFGPQARGDLRDELHAQVTRSISQGARLLLGGKPVPGRGYFYEPTVLADVKRGITSFDEEMFGPVASMIVAKDADDAVEIANDSDFGLSSAIWTRDVDKARDIARRIESGGAFVNGFTSSDPRVPVGGVKKSGYGRELSHFGIREFMNAQTVWIKTS
jgi:succinate-semialdehyde dehydrogenase